MKTLKTLKYAKCAEPTMMSQPTTQSPTKKTMKIDAIVKPEVVVKKKKSQRLLLFM